MFSIISILVFQTRVNELDFSKYVSKDNLVIQLLKGVPERLTRKIIVLRFIKIGLSVSLTNVPFNLTEVRLNEILKLIDRRNTVF